MAINIYKVAYSSGTLRTRYALFVEAEEDNTGYFIHVFGDVQQGMEYKVWSGETDWGVKAENVDGFLGKELLGTVEEGMLMVFMDVCESVPPPGKQLDELGRKIDKEKPFYRDGEWVDEVIQKLKDAGLLQVI